MTSISMLLAVLAAASGPFPVAFSKRITAMIRTTPVRPYCGLYCLFTASHALDQPTSFDVLLKPEYVGSIGGSSASNLVDAARAVGLRPTVLRDATIDRLFTYNTPVILHYRLPSHNSHYTHWVLYLGRQAQFVRVMDPNEGVRLVKPSELAADWDGIAIVLESDRGNSMVWTHFLYALLIERSIGLFLLVLALLFLGMLIPRIGRVPMVAQVLTLLTVAASVFAVKATDELSFINNPDAVRLVQSQTYRLQLPEVDVTEIKELLARDAAILVDARTEDAFQGDHLPNARLLAVNSTRQQRDAFVAETDPNKTLVVYCQSKHCRWGELVASDLYFRGIRKVAIFRGGMNAWRTLPNGG